MNLPVLPFVTLHCLLTAWLVLTGISCSTPPPAKRGDSSTRDSFTIAGFGKLKARGETRQDVVARLEWRQRHAPELSGQPKVRKVVESPGFPGISIYIVDLGVPNASPVLHQLVVLMEGTVIAGELESDK